MFGEPLVADGRIVAATENDTVYVLAANTGKVLWSTHLATPVPSSDLPCGDISPQVGITGTPVIDMARHEIFVVADTLINGPAASNGVEASHRLFGLNLITGKVELNQRAMPKAGEDQLAQLQRPGLALDDGNVVIAYGQNAGDCPGPNGPAHGFVVSISESGGQLHYFQIGSGQDRGAVWMGGSSPVVDPNGNVYVASGDGYSLGAGQPYDDSDAVLELSPSMQLESKFYLSDWQSLSAQDLDLGTGDPALVGRIRVPDRQDGHRLSAASGASRRRGRRGRVTFDVQRRSQWRAHGERFGRLRAVPQWLDSRPGVVDSPVSDPALDDNDGTTGSPIIADGLVWVIDNNALHGLNPANGEEVVSISYGGYANHFPTPAVGDGLLLVPGTDQVIAYMGPGGLPPAPPAQ